MMTAHKPTLLPERCRQWFHVPGPGPYFQAHSAGALPAAASDAIEEYYLKPWMDLGGDAWATWLPAINGFRDSLSAIIGGSASGICPQPNVSAAFEHYLGALPTPGARDTILMAEESFPSLGYVAKAAEALGFTLRFLPPGTDPGDAAAWSAAIDERTAVVLVMHVYSNSGRIAPIPDIVKAAREKGGKNRDGATDIKVVVDIAQSVGIVPVAVRHWGVDAAVGSCLKWLSGGAGAGFLWVPDKQIASLKPRSIGWFSHEEPFEMDIHDFRYAPDALRFWGGTPDVAPFVTAKAGIDTILSMGVNMVRAHNRVLQAEFRASLQDAHPHWRWPDDAIGGTLCIDVGEDRPALAERLTESGTRADFRGNVMRLSFAAWNRPEEVQATAALLKPKVAG